ncbi:MAG: hypothetical protein K6E99_00340 [Bacilli bacterium]|nr:hypothetical protein [Bacilli bacterium]
MKNSVCVDIYTPQIKKDECSFFKSDNIDVLNVYIKLYNAGFNVESLRENNKTLKFQNYSDDGQSGYRFIDNTIEVPDKIYKDTITHELLHCASTILDGHAAHVGLMYGDFKTGELFGLCLNEGMTATLDLELFGDYTDTKRENEEEVYPFAKRVIEILELIVPRHTLDEAYFNSDLALLIKSLNKIRHNENEVFAFIRDLDFVFMYLDLTHDDVPENKRRKFEKAWNNVQYFLADSLYICLNRYYEEGMIDEEELLDYLEECKTILRAHIEVGGQKITKNKIRQYKKIEENYKNRKKDA